jgi:putative SOS response-associated peptidase YedK
MIPIHDRMPVILTKDEQEVWLNNSIEDLETIRGLMTTYLGNDLETHIVSTYVNNPDNEGPRCIERVPSLIDYFN